MSAFIDFAKVLVKAGDGGDGMISFRREKFVDKGGPNGGDGGHGGDVIAVASRNVNTLQNFRHKQKLVAGDGQPGGRQKRHGKNGEDLKIAVPIGTIVRNGDFMVADLTEDGQEAAIALGGQGGFGNAHFTSSTRQAPRVAEKGEPGDKYEAILELKLLADVGLVGLPNAGKSTFLSVVSNARPKIADYAFTTLEPNLGVADVESSSLLIADIPGLIAGASQGKGLGDDFLRHVERTAVLLHLVDSYNDDVASAYKTINNELKNYDIDLTTKPQVVVLTKIESLDKEIVDDLKKQLRQVVPKKYPIMAISAVKGTGLKPLLKKLAAMVKQERARVLKEQAKKTGRKKVITLKDMPVPDWEVAKHKQGWLVSGPKIEKFVRRTDFESEWGVHRLRDIMQKLGIFKELSRLGASIGDKIYFPDSQDYIEY